MAIDYQIDLIGKTTRGGEREEDTLKMCQKSVYFCVLENQVASKRHEIDHLTKLITL